MIGKLLAGAIVISALVAAGAMFYLQVYHFYDTVEANSPDAEIQITNIVTGEPEPMLIAGFEGIDSHSSPIRFRACFTTPMSNAMMTETFKGYPAAEPLVAPDWFKCFDAKALGAALETGTATAYLSEENIIYGIDRVVAVYDDGRAFAWHQINTCGEHDFNGEPLPTSCPPKPKD